MEIKKELFLNNNFKEYYNRGFGDFGEYHSYSRQFYSNRYEENVLVYFKTPINPQANYWKMIVDNDLLEDFVKINVFTIEDINKIFEILKIDFRF